MTRAEVIALMATLKAKPEERRQAQRLWLAGVPRKRIAAMLGVSEHTVKDWRYKDQWPSRHNRSGVWSEPEALAEATEEQPTCFVCAGRCQTWDGHASCRGKAA